MRSFKQLFEIAQIYTKQFTSFPCNPFLLCTHLQIPFKVKSQAVEDFAGANPLISTPAILYKESGKVPSYIIYFDVVAFLHIPRDRTLYIRAYFRFSTRRARSKFNGLSFNRTKKQVTYIFKKC